MAIELLNFGGSLGRGTNSFSVGIDDIEWQLALEVRKPLGHKGLVKVAVSELPSSAVVTLNNYEVNLSIARMLGDALGFKDGDSG